MSSSMLVVRRAYLYLSVIYIYETLMTYLGLLSERINSNIPSNELIA